MGKKSAEERRRQIAPWLGWPVRTLHAVPVCNPADLPPKGSSMARVRLIREKLFGRSSLSLPLAERLDAFPLARPVSVSAVAHNSLRLALEKNAVSLMTLKIVQHRNFARTRRKNPLLPATTKKSATCPHRRGRSLIL
jgi:hypothetical protein